MSWQRYAGPSTRDRACGRGRVVGVVDWRQPDLFVAFGLPMSFPPSHGPHEDELNAKEVR